MIFHYRNISSAGGYRLTGRHVRRVAIADFKVLKITGFGCPQSKHFHKKCLENQPSVSKIKMGDMKISRLCYSFICYVGMLTKNTESSAY